jgi:hypothetical protein
MYVQILYLDKVSIVVGIKFEEAHRVFPFWVQPPPPHLSTYVSWLAASSHSFSFFLICRNGNKKIVSPLPLLYCISLSGI